MCVGDQSLSTIGLVHFIIQMDYLTVKYFYHQYWSSHISLNDEINIDIQSYFYTDMRKIGIWDSHRFDSNRDSHNIVEDYQFYSPTHLNHIQVSIEFENIYEIDRIMRLNTDTFITYFHC